MSNPWLDIPLADYEGHMASAEVRQTEALSDLFAQALAVRRPASVAVLGIAGGNGLERIDSRFTERVVGLDFNPEYLEATRQRFAKLKGLELHCVNLTEETLCLEPVEMVHAALIFEHAGVGRCLDNAISLLAPDGVLSVVLQLPSTTAHGVGKGGFASIEKLKTHFSLVDPKGLRAELLGRGMEPVWETQRNLAAGKAFWLGIFVRVNQDAE